MDFIIETRTAETERLARPIKREEFEQSIQSINKQLVKIIKRLDKLEKSLNN